MASLIVFAAITAIASGAAITWWRYGGFIVSEIDGVLMVSGGAVSHQTRSFPVADVQGVRIQRNALMFLLGYRRLSVVLRNSGGHSRTLDLLPIAKTEKIDKFIADRKFLQFVRSGDEISSQRGSALPVLALVSSLALGAIPFVVLDHPFNWISASLVALVHIWFLSVCWTTIAIQTNSGLLVFERGIIWRNEYRLNVKSVHLMHVIMGPLNVRSNLAFLRLYLFASRPICLKSARVNAAVTNAIFESISDRRPGSAIGGEGLAVWSAK